MPKRPISSTSVPSSSSTPVPSSSSTPVPSSSYNDEPSGNQPNPKGRSKYTSDQQARLNHLVFGLGCCRWTANALRVIRDIWLHIPAERGGGEGIGLTPRQILQYCKARGVDLLHGDERFEEFFRWLMAQPEYIRSLPPPVPYKRRRPLECDDTPPQPTSRLDRGSKVPPVPMEGPSSVPMGFFQTQAGMAGVLPPPPQEYFRPHAPPGSFPGPLWIVEGPSQSQSTARYAIQQAPVGYAYPSQSIASSEEGTARFFQMTDGILPERPHDLEASVCTPHPTAEIYPSFQGPSPAPVFYAVTAPTPVTTASLAVPSAAESSVMSPRSRVASRVGDASKSLLLALSPQSTAPSSTPPTEAADGGHITNIFRLKVRYTANGIEYLATTPGLISIDVKRENLLENIIEYEIVVKKGGVVGFLMKSPGFIGVTASQEVEVM